MQGLNRIVIIVIFLAAICGSNAQSLKLVRTDVDSTRKDFVTSTYIFAFDVIAENVEKCNVVAFELHYDKTEYVTLSESRVLGFGSDAYALVRPTVNAPSDEGIIHIGVLSGEDITEATFDNPRVIHLEFALAQSAPHGENINFTFKNAQAVVLQDGAGALLDLTADPVIYNIHSFVDVWPGDANDDGVVNTKDVTNIALFMGLGSKTKSMRSFKRNSGSTLWSGQRVLSWDSAAATFADCDGNGDITPYDALIVSLNYDKQQTNIIQKDADDILSNEWALPIEPEFSGKDLIKIPVKTGYSSPYIGISSKLSLSEFSDNYEFVGIERGDLFDPDNSFFLYTVNDEKAELSFGSIQNIKNSGDPGVLCYVVLRKNGNETDDPIINIEKLSAIDDFGNIFPVGQITGIVENDIDCKIFYDRINSSLIIKNEEFSMNNIFRIFDLNGNLLINRTARANYIDISFLRNGCYMAVFDTGKNQYKTIFIK